MCSREHFYRGRCKQCSHYYIVLLYHSAWSASRCGCSREHFYIVLLYHSTFRGKASFFDSTALRSLWLT